MSARFDDDVLMQALAALPDVVADEAFANQLRARCRAQLERPARPMPVTMDASVGAVCAMYAWHVLRIVVR